MTRWRVLLQSVTPYLPSIPSILNLYPGPHRGVVFDRLEGHQGMGGIANKKPRWLVGVSLLAFFMLVKFFFSNLLD